MIGLIIFSLLACSHADPLGLPSFSISGYSRSNVPEMSVTFRNGRTDDLILEPYSESPCNFIGELKGEPGSSVGVTGCLNNPEDKMHITLLSEHNEVSYAYELGFDGEVKADENPFENQKGRSGILPFNHLSSRADEAFGKHKDDMGDEEEDLFEELAADAAASAYTSWPSKIYAYIKFGYDNTLKAQLDKDGTTFNTWIDGVMTHIQTYYRHYTLPTKIEFKYNKYESIRRYEDLPSTEYLNDWSVYALNDVKKNPKVDLYVTFGRDPAYYGTVGLAWTGGACKSGRGRNDDGSITPELWTGTSFNEWRKTASATAATAAHEMGHNFGMSHDFDAKHGGKGGPCDGQGIMSYNNDKPMQWSSCSVRDFTGYYNDYKWGETCLKDWDAYVPPPPPCADQCPNSQQCTARPNTICSNPSRYGGCTGRYESIFRGNCDKTCGFCS